ncbi:HipA-like N-terminal domain-containing protein [Marinospirillum celere]|uniref:HipA-like N-terminal domain-containing protein n=1 Tax=Marinospirillum celere TaxID=1122252 RepID=A0A1I1EBK1_9GAMM|nr:HipA domain-containing protein [Marinospirillum celere]SFB83952.1 HipA-like N-terminal domain-containing protein [Marinospirillum celere]
MQLEGYIVKAWGDDYPQLALNEYYCMRVLETAGVIVPEFYLSDDDRLFIMKRFDLGGQGQTLGFEDLCVLQGKQLVSPQFKAAALEQLFKMLVLNNRLQNGDAHLKNFGVLYDDAQSIRLAPAFDVVSTTAYIREDVSALTLMGSRKWWDKKHLLRFGVQVCDLSASQAEKLYGECEQALLRVGSELRKQLANETQPDKRNLLEHLTGLML